MKHLIEARQWLHVYRLPPYAPELNPVEAVWSHLKRSHLLRRIGVGVRLVLGFVLLDPVMGLFSQQERQILCHRVHLFRRFVGTEAVRRTSGGGEREPDREIRRIEALADMARSPPLVLRISVITRGALRAPGCSAASVWLVRYLSNACRDVGEVLLRRRRQWLP
jgi:hypothetical protein